MNLVVHHTLGTMGHVLTRTMREDEDADMREVEGEACNLALTLVRIHTLDVAHFDFVSDFGLHGIDATGLKVRAVVAESRETADDFLRQFKATIVVEHTAHHAMLTLVNPDTAFTVDGLAVIPHRPRDIEVRFDLRLVGLEAEFEGHARLALLEDGSVGINHAGNALMLTPLDVRRMVHFLVGSHRIDAISSCDGRGREPYACGT